MVLLETMLGARRRAVVAADAMIMLDIFGEVLH